MKKKMAKIGEKAGIKEKEVKNITKIGISGLLAVTLAAFTGGLKEAKADEAKVQPEKKSTNTLPERCKLKPDSGPCKALFWKYYFDDKTKQCKEFIYGGCEGVVPFETKEECVKECMPENAGNTQPVTPDDNCGPFPGYPCGAKYFTVSLKDFRNFPS